MSSTFDPERRSPLRPMSDRRLAERATREQVVKLVRARDRICQAVDLVPSVKCRYPLDVHERVPRSIWRAGYLEPDNCLLICRAHHDWVDHHPDEAEAVGLHARSWSG